MLKDVFKLRVLEMKVLRRINGGKRRMEKTA
jgi:hypothetical protein